MKYVVCISVIKPEREKCHTQEIIQAEKLPKFLSSDTSLQTKCGLHDSPWVIQVQKGQQIEIGLTDFSWRNDTGNCVRYGYMLDTQEDDIISICGGGIRKRLLYISRGSTVQVILHESALEQHRFLLSFKGTFEPNVISFKF